jgi:hypothetical protein
VKEATIAILFFKKSEFLSGPEKSAITLICQRKKRCGNIQFEGMVVSAILKSVLTYIHMSPGHRANTIANALQIPLRSVERYLACLSGNP